MRDERLPEQLDRGLCLASSAQRAGQELAKVACLPSGVAVLGDPASGPRHRLVGSAGRIEGEGYLQHIAGEDPVAPVHLDESVGISGPYGPARYGLTDGEGVVRPVAGLVTDPLPLRLEPLAVRRQACLAENLGVLGGRSVEAVQLRGELQVHQAGCELHRIGPTLHAGPVMHLGQPQGDVAEPAVGVVDVVNRLVGAAVGVLGQTRRGVRAGPASQRSASASITSLTPSAQPRASR